MRLLVRTAISGSILSSLLLGASSVLAAPLSAPRIGAYPGYTRLALDVPAATTYSLEPLGAALRVSFTGATATTAASVKVGKPELAGYTLENRSGGAVLTVAAPQGVSRRSGYRSARLEPSPGKTGYRLVLDFSGAFADTSKLTNPPALALAKQPAQPFTVLLDPGHGGPDSGALGNGIKEATLNLDIAARVKAWLETMRGVRVQMTRNDNRVFSSDKRTDLNARAMASRGKTIFVSIHANAVPRASWNSQFGTEVYYYNPRDQKPLYVPAAAPLLATPGQPVQAPPASAPGSSPSDPLPPDPSWIPEAAAAMHNSDTTTETPPPTDPGAEGQPTSPVPDPAPGDATPTAPDAGVSAPDGTNDAATGDLSSPPETAPDMSPPAEDGSASALPAPPDTETVAPEQASAPAPAAPSPPNQSRIAASKDLAGNVLSRMLYAMSSSNRGVRTADFYVIKYSECPSILIETGFVTHPIEAQQLKNPNYLERTAYGIASGIAGYLNGLVSPQ